MQTVAAELNAGMTQVSGAEMAPRPTPDHIRMHLHHHRAVWVVVQRVGQHSAKALRPRLAKGDRSIACGLIHNEHKRLGRGGRLAGRVEFAQPLAAPQITQAAGPGCLRFRQGLLDPLLQPTGPGGIKMDAEVIHQQGQRRMLPALP